MSQGTERAGLLFEEQGRIVPESLICPDAMYAGLSLLGPHLKRIRDEIRHIAPSRGLSTSASLALIKTVTRTVKEDVIHA
ncbi:MAG: hypothetical protein ABSC19_02465 [Syntrophorhabdales bacterium]